MIKMIELGAGECIFVEVENLESSALASPLQHNDNSTDLPDDSRLTGSVTDTLASFSATTAATIKSQIHSLAKVSLDALGDLNPDEVSIEAHVKFSGDAKIIPFIASAKGDGGLKISITWRKK